MTRRLEGALHALAGAGFGLAGLLLSRSCAGSCGACFGCASAGGMLGLWLLFIKCWKRRRRPIGEPAQHHRPLI